MKPGSDSNQNALVSPLRSGLEALGLAASDPAVQQLLGYLKLLEKWNRVYNLSAVRDPRQMLHQHLLDCLAVLPALDRHFPRQDARLLDVGSGAGLPGTVLAIMRPLWSVICVDAVAKKASFVRQVAAELALGNLRAEHGRVEAMALLPSDLVISRAFASLLEFTSLTRNHLSPTGCWVAMKGRFPDEEAAALTEAVKVFHVEQLVVPGLQAQRCLVWMRPQWESVRITLRPQPQESC